MFMDTYDWIGPTGIIQDNLPIVKSADWLICHSNTPLPFNCHSEKLLGLQHGHFGEVIILPAIISEGSNTY